MGCWERAVAVPMLLPGAHNEKEDVHSFLDNDSLTVYESLFCFKLFVVAKQKSEMEMRVEDK